MNEVLHRTAGGAWFPNGPRSRECREAVFGATYSDPARGFPRYAEALDRGRRGRRGNPEPDDVRHPGQGHPAGDGGQAGPLRGGIRSDSIAATCPGLRTWSWEAESGGICSRMFLAHARRLSPFAKMPATRPDFWKAKLEGNAERDERNCRGTAESSGWRVLIVWECATRDKEMAVDAARDPVGWIKGTARFGEITGGGIP